MSRRNVTRIPVAGGQPALQLVEMDGTLFSSPVHGADPSSGALRNDTEGQLQTAFENLQRLLQLAGLNATSLGIVTVNLQDKSDAALIDKAWRTTFPDPQAGPTRKVNVYSLQADFRVQLEVAGVRGQSPRALKTPGLRDEGFPPAVRIGDQVFSTGIDGRDPETGKLSEDREAQVRQAYANLQALLADAGASWDDVLHVYAFLDRLRAQSLMHEVWEGIFTNHGRCPARKAIHYGSFDDDSTILQLQAVGVVGPRDRRDFLLENVPVHETGTMGAAIGRQMRSCGISGNPGGKLGTLDEQIEWAFKHMRAVMREAGGTTDDIGQVSILVRNYNDIPRILEGWRQEFPDRDDQPAHTWAAFGLNPSNAELVQFQIAGVL
jgi:2-iminobutanoate/2-iminopropanoate deaminase